MEDKILVSRDVLERLISDSLVLSALEQGGVEDWDWYYQSIDDVYENDDVLKEAVQQEIDNLREAANA